MENNVRTLPNLSHRTYFFNVFESMHDLANAVKAVDPLIRQGGSRSSNWYPRGQFNSFVGETFRDWNHVQSQTESYWPKGMEVYSRMVDKLRDIELPRPKSLKRELIWRDDDGFDLDLDRLQRDQPYWRATRRQHRPGPMSFTMVTDITTSGSYNTMDVLWRGAASVVLTEILERAGYRVELWVAQHCINSYPSITGRCQCTAVRLKRGSDPLDQSSLINATSGWAYRTLFFGAYWIGGVHPTQGLGTVADIKQIVPALTTDEQVCVVDRIYDERAAIQFIQTQINKLK